jgi:predicted transcriptional regulator
MNKIEYNTFIHISFIKNRRKQMKTMTMRVDDTTYRMIKTAADGQKRNLSNFIEFAVLQYLSSAQYVDSGEMDEILQDAELVRNLKSGMKDLAGGDYTLV